MLPRDWDSVERVDYDHRGGGDGTVSAAARSVIVETRELLSGAMPAHRDGTEIRGLAELLLGGGDRWMMERVIPTVGAEEGLLLEPPVWGWGSYLVRNSCLKMVRFCVNLSLFFDSRLRLTSDMSLSKVTERRCCWSGGCVGQVTKERGIIGARVWYKWLFMEMVIRAEAQTRES